MPPDLIVHADTIRTMHGEESVVESFAVSSGRLTAFGTVDEIEVLAGPDTVIHSFDGRTILPGFIDAHCHLSSFGRRRLLQVDCRPPAVESIDELVDRLRAEADETPDGEWVLGFGYDETKLSEMRHPTRWDLDAATTDHPVYLNHSSHHAGVVNSMALEKATLDADSPDPTRGRFERDSETGELTGVLYEDATHVFRGEETGEGLVPQPTPEEDQEALRLACAHYNERGITGVGDAYVTPSRIRMYREGVMNGNLTVRAYLLVASEYASELADLGLATGFGDDMVEIGAAKTIVDGAIAARTAYLSQPYEGSTDDYGDRLLNQEELNERVRELHEAGFQHAIHANGDRAIEMVLDAYERALEERPRDDHRHRIEHGTVVRDDLLDRMADLDVVVLPFATYVYQHGEKMSAYGDRVVHMFPHGSCLGQGISVAASTDHPAGLLDPLLAVRTMVTRLTADGRVLGPEERITVTDALRAYTTGAAYACFEEDHRGSLSPGKLADFVVLSDDPVAVAPERIHEIDVEATYVGGEPVYPP